MSGDASDRGSRAGEAGQRYADADELVRWLGDALSFREALTLPCVDDAERNQLRVAVRELEWVSARPVKGGAMLVKRHDVLPDDLPSGLPGEFGDLSPFTLEKRDFACDSEAPVHCFPVTLRGRVIGYLWASEAADAADFCARRGTGAVGFDAGGPWRRRLREAYEAGLSAWEAVQLWVGAPEDPTGGGVAADAEERVLPNSQAVRRLANQPVEERER